jgi:hypothetical protein
MAIFDKNGGCVAIDQD